MEKYRITVRNPLNVLSLVVKFMVIVGSPIDVIGVRLLVLAGGGAGRSEGKFTFE
jgi:hypothetical protein